MPGGLSWGALGYGKIITEVIMSRVGKQGQQVDETSHKRSSLLFHEVLLQHHEELLGFRQPQAEVLDSLAILLEGRYLLHRFFTTIVSTDYELHLQLHGEPSTLGNADRGA